MYFIFNGETFVNNEDNLEELYITDKKVVKKLADPQVTKYGEGMITSKREDGCFGYWDLEWEKNSKYYYINGENIVEFVIFEENEGIYRYLTHIDKFVYECVPEKNDRIYDSYKEAKIAYYENLKSNLDNMFG